MNLNIVIIQAYLEGLNLHCALHGNVQRAFYPDLPLLIGGKEDVLNMSPGAFYMVSADILSETAPVDDTSLICAGVCPQSWRNAHCTILSVSDCADVVWLYNHILLYYDRINKWETALNTELLKEADFNIRQVFLLGAGFLGYDVGMTDQSFQEVFYAQVQADEEGHFRAKLKPDTRYLEIKDIEKIKEVCGQEQKILTPYLSSIPYQGAHAYCYNLYVDGHFFGCAFMLSMDRDFSVADRALADFYFSKLRRAFKKYVRNSSKDHTPQLRLLSKLLQGQSPLQQEMSLFQVGKERPVYFRTIVLKRIDTGHPLPEEYTASYLNAVMPGMIFLCQDGNELKGILRFSGTHDDRRDIQLRLLDILDHTGYHGFLSDPYTDVLQTALYLKESLFLCLSDLPERTGLTEFADHRLQYFLRYGTGSLKPEMLYPEEFRNLIEYDQRKNADLVHTLSVYYQVNFSLTEAARRLYIHRSTLLKRMSRIKTIMKNNLDDYKQNLMYQICICLYDQNTRAD